MRRGLTPVRRLLEANVPVALASNNIRNPFTPVGTADLTHMAFIDGGGRAHGHARADLRALLAAITLHPARLLRLPDYGLAPGCHADLVAWDCASAGGHGGDAAAAHPRGQARPRDGRARHEVIERWRALARADRRLAAAARRSPLHRRLLGLAVR